MADVPARIDAGASHRNLADHLAPIWLALPEDRRGTFLAGQRSVVKHLAARWGIDAIHGQPHSPGGPILLANHHDLTQTDPSRPVIYVEHGAGQTYLDFPENPGYSGGRDGYRDQITMFLTLNETTAARERATYPDKPVHVVGSPRLDWLAERPRIAHEGKPVVALCWHFRLGLLPETYTAWGEYRHHLAALTEHFTVLGHGHPRMFAELVPFYEQAGIEPVEDFSDVVARADVVTFDNSSAGPEAAACGIPIVFLNSPRYRRDVTHHGRFWDWPQGQVSCNGPSELVDAIRQALADPPEIRQARERMVDSIYPPATRGKAVGLAVSAILDAFPG